MAFFFLELSAVLFRGLVVLTLSATLEVTAAGGGADSTIGRTNSGRLALLERPGASIPGYVAKSGFVSLDLDEDTDWDEIAELLEESFRQTAGVRLVRALG